MTRILDLSNREQDLPVDVVDLGDAPTNSESSTHPSKLTPPANTYTDDPYTYTRTNGGHNTTGTYSKLVNLQGLAGHTDGQSSSEHRRESSGCC